MAAHAVRRVDVAAGVRVHAVGEHVERLARVLAGDVGGVVGGLGRYLDVAGDEEEDAGLVEGRRGAEGECEAGLVVGDLFQVVDVDDYVFVGRVLADFEGNV